MGFKGVLTTYQIVFSSNFSHRVFGGEILKISRSRTIKIIHGHSSTQVYMKNFKMMKSTRTALSKGEC
jgi:hypothetical protein